MPVGDVAAVHFSVRNSQSNKQSNQPHRSNGGRHTDPAFIKDRAMMIHKIAEMHDTNNCGELERAQFKAVLNDLTVSDGGVARTIEEQDLDDLMKMCNISQNGTIRMNEVLHAVQVWRRHLRALPEIEPVFSKHDTNKTGRLNAQQLKNLLAELDERLPVETKDVDWVLRETEHGEDRVIGKLEIERALLLWRRHAAEKQKGCCSIQ